MDSQNIDQLFRRALDASEGHYDALVNESRDRVWKQVRKKQHRPRTILLISLAAACLLLLLVSSFLTVSLFRVQKSKAYQTVVIRQLTTDLVRARNVKEKVMVGNLADTVYVEKVSRVPVEVVTTRVDTVYVSQTVYIEKGQKPELNDETAMVKETEGVALPQNTEILISNQEASKKSKVRKFQIRLGGEKDQSGTGGTLALTAKY